MSYGYFENDGKQYVITTPKTPSSWYNYLFNDQYYMDVDQMGYGKSICLTPSIREFTRSYRFFYIHDKDNNEIWNPMYNPLKIMPESYKCTHSLGKTVFQSTNKGLNVELTVFVPKEGIREIWIQKYKNNGNKTKHFSTYTVFSFENGGIMGSKCQYNRKEEVLTSFAFPYHVHYEEKEKLDNNNSLVYMFSDAKPASFDRGEKHFLGCQDIYELPIAIKNKSCSNLAAESDNPIGAFEYRFELKPGEEIEFAVITGCANSIEEIIKIKKEFSKKNEAAKKLKEVETFWEETSDIFKIEAPDKNLNLFMNYWLKKQIILMTKNNRFSVYCPVRNQLQDAMGYSILDPDGAYYYMKKVLERQEANGFIKQWYMTDGSSPRALCFFYHKDAPIWLVLSFCILTEQTGSLEIFDNTIKYKESDKIDTVYEHLLSTVFYLNGQKGEHGLILMGDGDWTDPINGDGRLGRGESTWSSLGLICAVSKLKKICKKKNDKENYIKLENIEKELDDAINKHCWDGNWYVTGFDDNGIPFGKSADKGRASIFKCSNLGGNYRRCEGRKT